MFAVIKLCHLTSRSRAAVTAELSARTPGRTESAATKETLQFELIIASVWNQFILVYRE